MNDSGEPLVAAYLALAKAQNESQKESLWWAWEAMREMLWHQPEAAWPVILRLIARAENDETLAYIAAGPLENLLADHGPTFIERVEAQAMHDSRFRRALTGVWGRSGMDQDVIRRIDALIEGQPPL